MIVKIKKLHEDAVIPSYAKEGDAGMDLTAIDRIINPTCIEYKTGLAIEIPEGYFGLLRPRSSISKTALHFNTSGVIDSGYRGELIVKFKVNTAYGDVASKSKIGERIAQLIILPYPQIEFQEVDELSETERGTGGYGSTGS